MKPAREIWVLLVLLLAVMAGVLWYVARRRAHPPPPPVVLQEPVDLTKHDAQTIDFSSGKPVVKDSPQDKAALEAGLKEIEAATATVTFDPPKKKAEPAPAPPEKK